MAGEDDDDLNRTVIRPRPAGRPAQPGQSGSAESTAAGGDAGTAAIERVAADNPLVAAAGPLLMLAALIRGSASQPDVEGLRRRVASELRAFEERAGRLELPRQTVRQARFALAATIDDLAQNTPWGGNDVWARRSMVTLFDREAIGGERFYEVLEQAHAQPGANLWLLELMYLCLSFGFEGKLRVSRRGPDELARLRNGLYATIRNQRGEIERGLSPHWRGMEVAHRALKRRFPLWVVGVVTAGIMAFTWLGLTYLLNIESDEALAAMAAVPGIEAEEGRAPVPLPEPEPDPERPSPLAGLKGFLEPEIRAGLVEVFGKGQTVVVRLSLPTMFASGSDRLSDEARGILERVAKGLETEPGAVEVVGHSDNVPIRTARFPSNWALSEARAEAAAGVVRAGLSDPARVSVEGRGASEPIADNSTAAGRAKNRRIEVTLKPDRAAGAVVSGQGDAQ